jgi:hypothetical protein
MPGYLPNMVGGLAAEDSLPIPALTHHVELLQALGMRGGYGAVQIFGLGPCGWQRQQRGYDEREDTEFQVCVLTAIRPPGIYAGRLSVSVLVWYPVPCCRCISSGSTPFYPDMTAALQSEGI